MSVNRRNYCNPLLLAGAVLALPLWVNAAPPQPPGADGPDACEAGFHGGPPRPPGPPMGPGFGLFGGDHEEDRPPPFLLDLKLTDAQQDKVFAIMHAAAPALREQSKAMHKAREALHELSQSPLFNEGTAAALAQAQGKAESELALLRTHLEYQAYSLLTAEQRAQVAGRQRDMESHRGDESPRH
jgi:periplasmic protein CpxP/Spy